MSKITVRIDEPTIEDLRSLLQLVDLFIDTPTVDTHLYAVAVTGILADMPVIDPVPAPSPWLEVLKNLTTGPEPEAVDDNAAEPDDDQVLIVGSPVLTEALASIALDGDTRSDIVPDPPRKQPKRTVEKRPTGRPPTHSNDQLKKACENLDPDKPVAAQLAERLKARRENGRHLYERALKAGYVTKPNTTDSGLGPIERRPFNPDAVKAGAIHGIGNSGLD